jgi:hypothetical protein
VRAQPNAVRRMGRAPLTGLTMRRYPEAGPALSRAGFIEPRRAAELFAGMEHPGQIPRFGFEKESQMKSDRHPALFREKPAWSRRFKSGDWLMWTPKPSCVRNNPGPIGAR